MVNGMFGSIAHRRVVIDCVYEWLTFSIVCSSRFHLCQLAGFFFVILNGIEWGENISARTIEMKNLSNLLNGFINWNWCVYENLVIDVRFVRSISSLLIQHFNANRCRHTQPGWSVAFQFAPRRRSQTPVFGLYEFNSFAEHFLSEPIALAAITGWCSSGKLRQLISSGWLIFTDIFQSIFINRK